MKLRTILPLLSTALLLLRAHESAAEVPAICDAPHELDKYRSLRRLSLDLRNRPPSFEEYEALDAVTQVPKEVVQSYVASDEYRVAMRRFHENQYWPNTSNVRLSNVANSLTARAGYALALPGQGRERIFRGLVGRTCANREQTAFDAAFPGQFRPTGVPVVDGAREEGWRKVKPYWAPTTEVEVCAYDAQETISVVKAGKTIMCNSAAAQVEQACGCGPNLRFCYGGAAAARIHQSLREQLGRMSDKVTTGAVPYTELFLAQDIDENGTIAFWRKYLAPSAAGSLTYNVPLPGEAQAANPDFTDDAWHVLKRDPVHSGILTSASYLLRFQTDRGRANRLRINLMGQYFVPAAKLAPEAGCSNEGPDLTKRCNCQYCHKILEPLAAHFGAFVEAGSAGLYDRTTFPTNRPECVNSNDAICRRFYVTDPDAPSPGSLLPFQFAGEHPNYATSIAAGPRALVQAVIADGTLAKTVVIYALERLLKRGLEVEGEARDDLPLVEQLAKEFTAGGYQFPSLVQTIVSLPEYRRVR